jgi:hypothetical protein
VREGCEGGCEGLERLGWLSSVPVLAGLRRSRVWRRPSGLKGRSPDRYAPGGGAVEAGAPARGNRVKNDRRDAFQLARLVRPGDIVQVRVPTVEQEAGPGPGPGRRPGRFDAGQASVVEVPAAPRHRLQRRHHLGAETTPPRASWSPRSSCCGSSSAGNGPTWARRFSLWEDYDGWRCQAFATDTGTGQLAWLEARHRAHARVEDRIKAIKQAGLGRFPSRSSASTRPGCS